MTLILTNKNDACVSSFASPVIYLLDLRYKLIWNRPYVYTRLNYSYWPL